MTHLHDMKTGLIAMSVLLLLAMGSIAHGATVSGTTYDGLTLEPLGNSILTINTSPMQTKVSKDGTYVFTAENGAYILDAEFRENGVVTLRAQRTILIDKEGDYTIDIILLPDVGMVPTDPLPGEESEPTFFDQLMQPALWWSVLIVILAAAGYSIWNVQRNTHRAKKTNKMEEKISEEKNENVQLAENEPRELDQYAVEVINHMKRGGNRLTQKELRGMMNIGEAKVSLVVSELEEEKIIKKIKRGRGNILVLTEKGINYISANENKTIPTEN